MGVREHKINQLLDLFLNSGELSGDEIKKRLDIRERSLKYYIKELRALGYKIISIRGKYKLVTEECSRGALLSPQDLRILKILLIVADNNGLLTRKELVNKVLLDLCDEESISEKTVERAIKHCINKKLIYLDEENKFRLSVTTESIHVTDDDEIFKFMERCELYKTYTAFPDQVNEIKMKIIKHTGFEPGEYTVYSIGRPYKQRDNLKDILLQLEEKEYRKKAVYIAHRTRTGVRMVKIHTATILYNADIDRSYVIGRVNGNIYFIPTSGIDSIYESDEPNNSYMDRKILNLLDQMFGSSIDGPHHVKVEFQNIFNIHERILRIHKNRKSSKLTVVGDKIIYEDTICGLYDFARFLRGFGYACRVLEPAELKEIMKRTYEKILQNYGVETDDR